MRARSCGSSIFGSPGSKFVRDQALLEHPVDRILISGLNIIGHDPRARGNAFGETPCIGDRWLCARGLRAQSTRHRARPARRRGANTARTPNAASARRDTTCPGRNAAGRPARSGRAAAGSDRRRDSRFLGPSAAGIPFRGLIIVDRNEGRLAAHGQAHIVRFRSASTFSPSASSAAHASSENGAVTRGCSAIRATLMS